MSADPYDVQPGEALPPEVFISYARRDSDKVRLIADQLAALGISLWLDHQAIPGGENYAEVITRGIKLSRVFLLMCSDASLRSREVKQELNLAWKYQRTCVPLLLEPVSFPEQFDYFLAGLEWIEVPDAADTGWLPRVRRSLALAGVAGASSTEATEGNVATPPSLEVSTAQPSQARSDLSSLRALASFSDCIWPIAANRIRRDPEPRAAFRGLGAPQTDVQHGHRIGSHLGLAIQTERAGHLLLIDEGPEGISYCLCPSWFAPRTQIETGMNFLPQKDARYESFEVSGIPGREQLLAIITDEPLALNWMPSDPRVPARVLSPHDVDSLLTQLRQLDPTSWVAFATYFDVVA